MNAPYFANECSFYIHTEKAEMKIYIIMLFLQI